jgi:hypothetical protein
MRRSIAVLALVAAALVCSSPADAQTNPFGSCQSTIRPLGQTPEPIPGREPALRYTFVGTPVVITCDDVVLQAETIVVETDTQDLQASGNVVLQQADLRIAAERADINLRTKLGRFYNANGIARIGDPPEQKSAFGTLESDVVFYGEVVEKAGPKTYKLRRGAFTTCAQPTPRWEMTMGDATITVDEYAFLRNVVLRVKDVPVFYLPALYYPMKGEDRATGFLLPTYGGSTLRGNSLSNAFFLAISRSQDATFFHDWTSKFGQGIGSEYRYVQSPTSRGRVNFYMYNTPATVDAGGGLVAPASRSYQFDGDMNQSLPARFRLIARTNYFTDVKSQQLYQDVYDSAERQRRSFVATVNGMIGRMRLTATTEQNDYFYSRNGQRSRQRSGRLPTVNLSLPDRAIGGSRVYVGGSGQVAYLVDQNDLDDPSTNQNLWRFDGGPSVRAPLSSLSFLSATAEASWRITHWGESLDVNDPDVPRQVTVGLTRQLIELQTEVTGPVLARVFPGAGVKHVIEPRFSISRTSSFLDFERVVQIDSVDRLIGGVTQINYGIINRLLVRRGAASGGRPAAIREVLSVSITQSYYSNALASIYDPDYSTTTNSAPSPFSPVSLRASFRPGETAAADFRMDIDSEYRAIRSVSATARLDSPTSEVSAEWSKRMVIPGLRGFSVGRHFLSGGTTFRSRNNHLGGSYRFSYDVMDREFVHQRILAYYNSQCCGISFDWQTMSTPLWTPQGVPTNTQFGISVTLAGIGSFANPMGSFGGR